MKKFVTILLAAATAATLAIGFSACGNNQGNGGQTNNSQGSGNGSATSYEVTESTWKSVMSSRPSNYTEILNFPPSGYASAITSTTKYDGDKIFAASEGGITRYTIYTKENGDYYLYSKSNANDNWEKKLLNTEYDYTPYDHEDTLAHFKDDYKSFTYSEETHEYLCEYLDKSQQDLQMMIKNIKVKFESGSLVSISFATYSHNELNLSAVLNDFGTTVVEIPQI